MKLHKYKNTSGNLEVAVSHSAYLSFTNICIYIVPQQNRSNKDDYKKVIRCRVITKFMEDD